MTVNAFWKLVNKLPSHRQQYVGPRQFATAGTNVLWISNCGAYSEPVTSHALGDLAGSRRHCCIWSRERWPDSRHSSLPPYWKINIISAIQLRQSMRRGIFLKNNPAKFIPIRFEEARPQQKEGKGRGGEEEKKKKKLLSKLISCTHNQLKVRSFVRLHNNPTQGFRMILVLGRGVYHPTIFSIPSIFRSLSFPTATIPFLPRSPHESSWGSGERCYFFQWGLRGRFWCILRVKEFFWWK